ncbi:SGNH/GDSL hydrolase family protein [Lusitaniella coriacea LEGE 07157]|uniref:SGNH/GDSL hydrolase family protein n=1 Tax=Lusitaniella coriacea LEGE 07157 TaxID=945747 RepID=A0A8J7DXR5_9CYAN|nr:SGNH/GDSL hydrolase family protein [Lusitaniella coriacea]MBE9116975.1 SGNH/GDSL hydrolase family protein [Lusitaniella coriacea LEGE 07157]
MVQFKPWQQNLLLVCFGIFSGLVVFEIALRLVNFSYPKFYIANDVRGRVHRPGAEGWWRSEGEAYIKINRDGLRDIDRQQTKPQNTFRIALLGDSFAAAFQVPQAKTFAAILENKLSQCPKFEGKNVEVINFGVSGYGTAQQLLTLRTSVWSYSPDLVLLTLLTGNDIRNNSKSLEPDKVRPFFVYEADRLVPDFSFRNDPMFQLNQSKEYLRLGHLIARVVDSIGTRKQIKEDLATQAKTLREPGMDEAIYLEPTTPEWQEAWQITEDLLKLIDREIQEKNAEFWVVTLSNSPQVHPNPAIRQQYRQRWGIQDLFYPDRRIKKIGDRAGFPVLNLAPLFQKYADRNRTFFHGFKNTALGIGHWNETGHALAGETMAKRLCAEFEPNAAQNAF